MEVGGSEFGSSWKSMKNGGSQYGSWWKSERKHESYLQWKQIEIGESFWKFMKNAEVYESLRKVVEVMKVSGL